MFLDLTALLAVVGGLGACMLAPQTSPLVVVGITVVLLFLADWIAGWVSDTRLAMPKAFWWNWQTIGIVLIRMVTWIVHGLVLSVLVRDLPGEVGAVKPIFFTCVSVLLGTATGLPGGIGATEGLLGMFLSLAEMPDAHMAVAVGVYRLVTFWLMLPIGWIALTLMNRRANQRTSAKQPR